MKTTRWLLAGLLAGTMAVGTACKTDEAQRMPSTPPPAPSMSTDAGTGGAGSNSDINQDTRDRVPDMNSPDMNQLPPDHQMPSDQPGTGGSGMDPQDMRGPGTVGDDTIDNPLPQPPPIDSSMKGETQDNISQPPR